MSQQELAAQNDWMALANCKGHPKSMFFQEVIGYSEETRLAKELCARCPVWKKCLKFSIDNNEQWGLWGGLSVNDRKVARKSGGARICPSCNLIRVSFRKSIKTCDTCTIAVKKRS